MGATLVKVIAYVNEDKDGSILWCDGGNRDCDLSTWGHQKQIIVYECPDCKRLFAHKVCQKWPISEIDCTYCYAHIEIEGKIPGAR